ncbi:MAG: CRISPR-associated endonuclease Cas1 [Deltaproteobacteria bacterium]|nr:MAG: CRISPR-associated endonuclease Cas1 [Deltaproteobacteria bacterium]
MEAIYVLEAGTYLRKEGMSLKVVKGSNIVDEIPVNGLKRLTLMGYTMLSGAVLDFLVQNRVETVFLTPTGRFRARLAVDEHRHVNLRRAQYLMLSNPNFSLKTAKIIVRGKIQNMARFLTMRSRQYQIDQLRIQALRLKSMARFVQETNDLDRLRGIEGHASRLYYEVFPLLIRNSLFEFQGRNKRPPRDPVNAMLSFVYTMLTNEVLSAINACGLDPYLGSLHEVAYGRPSLACDLVEEYRCFLGDRFVLALVNRKAVSPGDFVCRRSVPDNFVDEEDMKEKRPVEMKPSICKAFIASYEEMMNRKVVYSKRNITTSYRMLIHYQVRSFAEYLQNPKVEYAPFAWEK